MHTVTIAISPATLAIGTTSLGVPILSLEENEVNGVILTVSKHRFKCKKSKWTESPCFIVYDKAVVIAGLTVSVEITVDVDVAIVKTI